MTKLIDNNIDLILKKVLMDLKKNGEVTNPISDNTSIGSEFGKTQRLTKEIIGHKLHLTNPRARLPFNTTRKFNLYFALGQLIWNLSGSKDVESISYYNKRGRIFSDNNKTIYGNSYGNRLFDAKGKDQIQSIIDKLKVDPCSRRTFASIFKPEDNFVRTRDVPCTIGLQYFLRKDYLYSITYMRSNSAALVMPYNIFLFTMLQEVIANNLNVEIGEYIHICGSLHYYLDEEELVDGIIKEKIERQYIMDPIPNNNIKKTLSMLLLFEKKLRNTSKIDVQYWKEKADKLGKYWDQIGYILIHYALLKRRAFKDIHYILKEIKPQYHFFLKDSYSS